MSVSDDFFPILFCFFSAFRDTKKFVTNFTHHSPFWIRFVIHIRMTWVSKIGSACLGATSATTSAAIVGRISDQIFHSAPSSILFLWNCEFFSYVLFACSTYVLAFAFFDFNSCGSWSTVKVQPYFALPPLSRTTAILSHKFIIENYFFLFILDVCHYSAANGTANGPSTSESKS